MNLKLLFHVLVLILALGNYLNAVDKKSTTWVPITNAGVTFFVPSMHISTPTKVQVAIDKITAYAQNPNNPTPTLQDYQDAGITGVNVDNLNHINEVVGDLIDEEANTVAKIQNVINDYLGIDTTAPVITIKKASTYINSQYKTIETDGTDYIRLWQWNGTYYEDTGVAAIDEVDGVVPVTVTLPTGIQSHRPSPGVYTVVFTAVDKAGNKSTATRTVTILEDTTYPVISFSKPSPMITTDVEILDKKDFMPHVTDENSAAYTASLRNVTVDFSDDEFYLFRFRFDEFLNPLSSYRSEPRHPGTYTFHYRAFDNAGHQTIAKFIVIVQDTSAPTISLKGNKLITLEIGDTYAEPGVNIYDNDTKVTPTLTTSGNVDTSRAGTYTITYTATDKAGNKATATRTVTILAPDRTPPVLTLKGASEVYIPHNSTYNELGASAVDAKDGTVSVKITGSVNTSIVGTYRLTYTAIDKAGNSVQKTRWVMVVSTAHSNKGPKITIKGLSPGDAGLLHITEHSGGKYVDKGATAVDRDGNPVSVTKTYGTLTESLFEPGAPKSKQGIYIIIYTAVDSKYNVSKTYRLVFVNLAWWYPSSSYHDAARQHVYQ